MIINAYLTFDGTCKEAFEFYQSVLGGEIVMMSTYRDSPAAEHTPADQLDRIIHARLIIGTNVLMGSDAPPQFASQPAGFSVSISLPDADEGRRLFTALSDKAEVKMPFTSTFWSPGFGMLVDQYGIPWMVNCDPA